MASVNKVILVGALGADPEVKSFQNGGRIANLRVATSESWKDKQTGEKKERTEWHSVSIQSDGLVGVAERFLRKGSKVYLEGQLRTRKWQAQDGSDRYSTEVCLNGPGATLVMLDSAQGAGGAGRSSVSNQQADSRSGATGGSAGNWGSSGGVGGGQRSGDSFTHDLSDDIPFLRCDGLW